jgi:hypothetical protein
MQLRSALLGVAVAATPAWGQIDYRNLDRGRPLAVEDAYPIERYAFELSGSYLLQARGGNRTGHQFEPELSYGIGKGMALSLAAPLVLRGDRPGGPTGLAGLGASLLANLTTERPGLPGLAMRLDATAPVGGAAPAEASGFVGLLGTMSIGSSRLNMSGGVAVARPDRRPDAEGTPLWQLGVQIDRTMIRTSTLVAAELVLRRPARGDPLEFAPAIGVRRQITPTLVLDAGLLLGLRAAERPRTSLTLGLSHLFALAALMPGVRP